MRAQSHPTVGSPPSPPSTKHRSQILPGKPSPTRFLTRNSRVELLGLVAVSENRIELDPSHVCLGDIGYMTAGALANGGFLRPRRIRKWVMSEVEETPSVRRSKSLEIGRASCRERVEVWGGGVAVEYINGDD